MALPFPPELDPFVRVQVATGVVPPLTHVDQYLLCAQEADASDLHLSVAAVPTWRRHGLLGPIWPGALPLAAVDTERLARGFLTDAQIAKVEGAGDVDFAYPSPMLGRFRVSVVRHRLGWNLVFRIINPRLRSMDELNLPGFLKRFTEYQNGLVLVTGAVGSGKSTTLAALVDQINGDRRDHIITLEDPVEYVIPPRGCHVTQREVPTHTRSFATALRGALREDPDVIVVGEMRDLETIALAVTAAETGHLVLGTLHTGSAARTLDRVLDVFPADQREQIRGMVSESLRGIVSQQLVPRADGQGRALALEVLVNTPAVGNCIRESKMFMLPGIIQTGRKQGMRLMDDSLAELAAAGTITVEEALARGVLPDHPAPGAREAVRNNGQRLRKNDRQVRRDADGRVGGGALRERVPAAAGGMDREVLAGWEHDPATLDPVLEISVHLFHDRAVTLRRGKDLHRDQRRLRLPGLVVEKIGRLSAVDAQVGRVGPPAEFEGQLADDAGLAVLEEFSNQIGLDDPVVSARHRFSAFLFVGERNR